MCVIRFKTIKYEFDSCLRIFYASKIMLLVCFVTRNKEGDARASDDIRVAKQTSSVITVQAYARIF